ncbi:MAG: glycosyltransferase family 2 protein [Clostridiales bacterium]|nr:glycosyltransferase family 2 protein [Clostridiales bacterium]
MENSIKISICLCTYHRPHLLKKCLTAIYQNDFTDELEVIVIDNDANASAKDIVEALQGHYNAKNIALIYAIEKIQGIASARNLAVSLARGKYLAFIDDDEVPDRSWLSNLYKALVTFRADAVWGPVIPIFPSNFPKWQKKLFTRARVASGTSMKAISKGTGNLLISSQCLQMRDGPFDTSLNQIGGSDTDLFNWLSLKGYKFVWCDEAVVYELQHISRSKIRWHLKRAYRGGWVFSLQKSKMFGHIKALLLILFWVCPAALLNMIKAIRNACIKTILLEWIRIISTQSGKIGFFLGLASKEYKTINNR